MNVQTWSDVALFGSAGVVGLLAIGLAAWALLADRLNRSRRRRRCPRCWYDLSQTDGLRCSECGHTARRERQLRKSRRRWRWVFAAAALMISAAILGAQPRVRRDGWSSIIPTTGLLIASRIIDVDEDGWRRKLGEELVERIRRASGDGPLPARAIPEWQWRLAIRSAIARGRGILPNYSTYGFIAHYALRSGWVARLDMRDEFVTRFPISIELKAPPRWPLGQTLYAEMVVPEHHGFEVTYDATLLDCRVDGALIHSAEAERYSRGHYHLSAQAIAIEAGDREGKCAITARFQVVISEHGSRQKEALSLAVVESTIEVDFGGAADEHVEPWRGSEVDALVQNALRFSTSLHRNAVRIWIDADDVDPAKPAVVPYVTPRLELVRDDVVVASAVTILDCHLVPTDCVGSVDLELNPDQIIVDATWRLRAIGDPTLALRDGPQSRYWAGVLEYEVTWSQEGDELRMIIHEPTGERDRKESPKSHPRLF